MQKHTQVFFSLLMALSASEALAGPYVSDGDVGPQTDVSCESRAKDVSVRIMRYPPNFNVLKLVVIHQTTLLPFVEVVTLEGAGKAGSPSIFRGAATDLTVESSQASVVNGRLQTRPYSGDLKLLCKIKSKK